MILTVSSDEIDNYPIPDHIQEALPAVGGGESNWKSIASAPAKLFFRLARDTLDVFPPFRSTVGVLCAILESIEVQSTSHPLLTCLQLSRQTDVDEQAIESLVPRVRPLVESLCRPGSQGNSDEKRKREESGR